MMGLFMPFRKGAVPVGLVVPMTVPRAGITLIRLMWLDLPIISRIPGLQRLVFRPRGLTFSAMYQPRGVARM